MQKFKMFKFHTIALFSAFVICFMLNGAGKELRADTHAESAFLFADKRDWANALGHAKRSNEQGLMMLMEGLALLDTSYNPSPAAIQAFMLKHPGWPETRRLQIRFEQAYVDAPYAAPAEILEWFKRYPPITGAGKWAEAQALAALNREPEKVSQLTKEAWVDGDFSATAEQSILTHARPRISAELHKQRAERLVWEGQYSALKRMQPHIPADFMRMLEARIALESGDKQAPALFARLPKNLSTNPGITYSRLVWRQSKKDDKGVIALLLQAPKQVPYAEKWWKFRERHIREALQAKNHTLAANLLKNHGLESGVEFAEAVWLKGWLKLEFLNKPKEAYVEFDTLYRGVTYSISKARAAYWAGRAAEKLGEKETADTWYQNAAHFPTTFYGQLGHVKAHPGKPLQLPESKAVDSTSYKQFKSTDIARLLTLTVRYKRHDLANCFIRATIDNSQSQQEMQMLATLAGELHGKSLGLKAAKRALQYNVFLGDVAYPTLDKKSEALDAALTHSIIRQESEFDTRAASPAGALGMMQLLPSTAREVARRNGLNYTNTAIYNEAFNTTLGSMYLATLIRQFDGNYVLAIAAYNAGQGRVRQWLNTYGAPRGSTHDVINWIEGIPYSETRNYVQRVLENLQVYRALSDKNHDLYIELDLKR